MSTPTLWIFLPILVGGTLLFFRSRKTIALSASILTLFLTLAAWLLPIDTAMTIGGISLKISSSFEIFGRHLMLTSADRSLLALIYGSSMVWFAVAPGIRAPRRFTSLGLIITAILVAALAVEPFLYAALLIEMAVLLTVPLLSVPGKKPGKGLLRFLIFQTLAMPFILFSGWLLAGIEANPGNLGLVQQAAILIGLGFAFLLAVFPFYSWIPMLIEESSVYVVGFIFWLFPTVNLFFGLGFLDHYTWLKDLPDMGSILMVVGTLMVVSGGILSAFQRQLGRIMGYAMIMETGFSILAISLMGTSGLNLFFMLLIPRFIGLLVWAFSLSILKNHSPVLELAGIKGIARVLPFASSGLMLSLLAMAGMPLLAGFPAHQAIWENLAVHSLPVVAWVLAGGISLIFTTLRVLSVFVMAPEGTLWESHESNAQRILLALGYLVLLLLGIFPQLVTPLWANLPVIFTHLGQ